MGVVLKRAQYFITCNGKYNLNATLLSSSFIEKNLFLDDAEKEIGYGKQLSLFN